MQKVYNVGFILVSLIFVLSCVGFISGSFLNMHLTDKLGFGPTITLGALCQVIAFSLQAPAPPFPLFVFSFIFNGFGFAIQNLRTPKRMHMWPACVIQSFIWECFMPGAGALSSPLLATQFAQMHHWSFRYPVSLGLAVSNVIILTTECLALVGEAVGETNTSDHSNFRQIMSLKSVHILAFFTMVYVGVEVTIGGWITIDVRGRGPGYISSGFFGGADFKPFSRPIFQPGSMFGRLALLWLNKKVGEKRVLYIYAALAISLELVVWFVPSLIGGAVAVSLIGVFFGPMYPIVMNYVGRVIPRWWIAGFGQTGNAFLPFVTGAIASKTGIRALQPLYDVLTSNASSSRSTSVGASNSAYRTPLYILRLCSLAHQAAYWLVDLRVIGESAFSLFTRRVCLRACGAALSLADATSHDGHDHSPRPAPFPAVLPSAPARPTLRRYAAMPLRRPPHATTPPPFSQMLPHPPVDAHIRMGREPTLFVLSCSTPPYPLSGLEPVPARQTLDENIPVVQQTAYIPM
ncbi:major facilitator superfamily domain-containing protein [Mycena leptocephala]|nr:major facilitator superfamily domain-containing protein [Mycena leptocephala]